MTEEEADKFWEQGYMSPERRPYSGKTNLRFKTPKALWEAACRYFTWVEEHPLSEEKLFHYQGKITRARARKRRAMSQRGLQIYLSISEQTWYRYTDNPDFKDVTSAIRDIIWTQKFEGAAADLFNPIIISRDLGLADKSELTGRDGGPVQVAKVEIVAVAADDDDDGED